MRTLLSVNKISEIIVLDKVKSLFYRYEPERVSFFGKKIKAKIYFKPNGREVKELDDDHFIINNIVYKRPRVKIVMTSGNIYCKHFDTYEEAKKYAKEMYLNDNCFIEF